MNNDPYNPQQQNNPEPQVAQPQQSPAFPENTQPQNPGAYTNHSASNGSSAQNSGSNKKLLIIVGIGVVSVLLIVVIAVSVLSGSKPQKATTNDSQQTAKDSLLSPAKALDIEQISNSISQDISSQNDDSQLPANRIDDKTLGL